MRAIADCNNCGMTVENRWSERIDFTCTEFFYRGPLLHHSHNDHSRPRLPKHRGQFILTENHSALAPSAEARRASRSFHVGREDHPIPSTFDTPRSSFLLSPPGHSGVLRDAL
jgi:hypothetical protein